MALKILRTQLLLINAVLFGNLNRQSPCFLLFHLLKLVTAAVFLFTLDPKKVKTDVQNVHFF